MQKLKRTYKWPYISSQKGFMRVASVLPFSSQFTYSHKLPYKGRIAHDVTHLNELHDFSPMDAQRITINNIIRRAHSVKQEQSGYSGTCTAESQNVVRS